MAGESSNAKDVERSMRIRAKRRKIIISIIPGIGLIAAGGLAIAAPFATAAVAAGMMAAAAAAAVKIFEVGSATFGFVLSSYIATVGVYNTRKTDPEYFADNLVNGLRKAHNEYRYSRGNSIDDDVRDLMYGKEFTEGHYLKDVLKEKIFLYGDPHFQEIIREIEARWMFSVIMNGMWHFERAYILDTNTNDRERGYRGPHENHVCLPEFPNRSVKSPCPAV
jgi:hypothetical protein